MRSKPGYVRVLRWCFNNNLYRFQETLDISYSYGSICSQVFSLFGSSMPAIWWVLYSSASVIFFYSYHLTYIIYYMLLLAVVNHLFVLQGGTYGTIYVFAAWSPKERGEAWVKPLCVQCDFLVCLVFVTTKHSEIVIDYL